MAKKTIKVQNSKKKIETVDNSFENIVSGFGALNPNATPLSKTDPLFNNNRWNLLSNYRQVLSQMYCEHGLIQALIDVPVDDAFRGGYEIKSKQLSADEIEQLKLETESLGVNEEIAQAFKWNRLFGGGGIIFMTNQDHDKPLDKSNLEDLELRAVDLWELFYSLQNIDDENSKLTLEAKKDFVFDYYGQKLHNSRVVVTKGIVPPSFVRPRLRGWGLSVVESLVQSINQHLKAKNLTYEVLDEFKVDYFKIKGFNQALLSPDGIRKIQKMVQLVNTQKNYQNAVTMDVEDSHENKQLTFAGLSEVMREVRIQIAADMRMPMTKLFGISSAGFNSGEDDIEVYNAMVESSVRFKAKKVIKEVLKLYSIKLFGIEATDIDIEFKPLRILSSEQEEIVKTSRLNRLITALDKQLCTALEVKEAINKENLLPVKVDVSEDSINERTEIGGASSEGL